MKKVLSRASIVIFFAGMIVFSAGLSCKKADEGPPSGELASADAQGGNAKSVAREAGAPRGLDAKSEESKEKNQGLAGHFLKPMEQAKQRLLEYRVDLTYESNDIIKSRQKLLGVAAKYGFINKSSASLQYKSSVATSEVVVKSDKLLEALEEFDTVGTLVTENIAVTDHTEEMVRSERSVKLEQIRIFRKNVAGRQVAPAAKNWNDIENSLAQSEDRLDASEHARWKIRDKVAWAVVLVTLKGPDLPERIAIPRYGDAFIGMVNILLMLVYAAIYILPVAAIAGLIVWKKKQIAAFFRRKKKED